MRIRRTILAPTIMALGTVGALVAAPAIAIAVPVSTAIPGSVASRAIPELMVHP